jgi:hypothetical protein
MKYIKFYLILTSIVFHFAAIISLVWTIPIYNNALKSGAELATSLESSETGLIEDVSEIEKDGLRYRGYKILYQGSELYVDGSGGEEHKKGDVVKVLITSHPYNPIKSLVVSVSKD